MNTILHTLLMELFSESGEFATVCLRLVSPKRTDDLVEGKERRKEGGRV